MTGAEARAFLAKRSRYRVLRPFIGYAAGDEITIVARDHDPHNSVWIWSFERVRDGCAASLTDLADEHIPILRALDTYLAPV